MKLKRKSMFTIYLELKQQRYSTLKFYLYFQENWVLDNSHQNCDFVRIWTEIFSFRCFIDIVRKGNLFYTGSLHKFDHLLIAPPDNALITNCVPLPLLRMPFRWQCVQILCCSHNQNECATAEAYTRCSPRDLRWVLKYPLVYLLPG